MDARIPRRRTPTAAERPQRHRADGPPSVGRTSRGIRPPRLDGMLDFVVAGLSANSVPYIEGLDLQRAVHRAVVGGERPDTVILLEHPSVYTAGKRTAPDERPTDGTPV